MAQRFAARGGVGLAVVGGIDFSAEDWAVCVRIPGGAAAADVLDLTGAPRAPRTSDWSIGRYDEVRDIYTTDLFADGRCVHVGLDIGGPVGTPVHAVADGKIAFAGYNAAEGDYGHTVITHHTIQGRDLWILHGHLDERSSAEAEPGAVVEAGEVIGRLGDAHENGGWPPHLHFQLSFRVPTTHDLPGVVRLSDRAAALLEFPDPRLVLGPLY